MVFMNTIKPIVILVRPQLAENIGATARAMANFGLTDLRLVKARNYDKRTAAKVACHGRTLLKQVQEFTTLESALHDCVFSIATSRRMRRVKIDPISPKTAAEKLIAFSNKQPSALVFGAERTGLTNKEIFLCDTASTIPTSEDGSLNLSQAVLLYLYEWFQQVQPVQSINNQWTRLATHQEKQITYDLLEQLMIKGDYKPITRLPEFIRRVKYLFEKRPLNYRENQIVLKLFRYLERISDK